MGLGNVPLPLLVALPAWRCEGFLAPLLERAKCNGEQKEFQIQAQLTKFMACPQKKGKKNVRVSWELLGTLYTLPKSVLVSPGAELIFSTAQAWGGCEGL